MIFTHDLYGAAAIQVFLYAVLSVAFPDRFGYNMIQKTDESGKDTTK